MQEYKLDLRLSQDFDHARFSSRLNRAQAWLRRRPSMLLPFEDVYARLVVRGRHDRGYQTVPLARIVGSQGRHLDFDRSFLPRTDRGADRWKQIRRAHYQERDLPPVELYKLGDIYFVADGNHRVSEARERGQVTIDAYVTEFEVDVPLSPELDLHNLSGKEEQSDFFAWTDLVRLRPCCDIEVSSPGGYLDLIAHINRHRRRLEAEHPSHFSRDEAIVHWYDQVYRPTVAAISQMRLPAVLRRRSAADLYLAVAYHQMSMAAETGHTVDIHAAVHDYLLQLSWRMRLIRAWQSMISHLPTGIVRRRKPS